jgi:phage terminase large subunit-like protein
MALPSGERDRLEALLAEIRARQTSRFRQFFPDDGPYRRELYPKHIEFFAAGARYKERLFMAANRIGKSEAGAFEVTCHLTGQYPAWWQGRRFEHPVEWWACGTNSQTTRDIVQAKLLGPVQAPGMGMIPAHLILSTTTARGLPGALEGARIKHTSGGQSILGFKSYEQGRQSFEGTAKDGIWDDEEPPMDVYTEQLLRTMTTKGLSLITFTPLQGMSEVVTSFLEAAEDAKPFKWFIQAGWSHVPHLDETEKQAIRASTPLYQVQARMEGEPMLGAGAIYPIAEAELLVPTRAIPETWRRRAGGWPANLDLRAADRPFHHRAIHSMHGRTRQPLGSRQLVKRFAEAAGADLQTLHAHQQTTREFLADVSQRVDALTAFQARSFWSRLRWLLTGR